MALKEGSDPFTNKNPSYQISFYMQHTGMEWGILTNGRLWRLYHRSSSYKLDHYYEVDLPELLTSENVSAFLYFYAFFHRSAFEDHPLSVRAILEQSTVYARSIGDSLKTQVYEALRHLAQGFLDHPNNGLETDPKTLREIYDNSLIVLYRLLFVLYAEARDLLPVRESDMYRDTYSLYAIKHDAAQGRALLPTSATLWPRLNELFRILNGGSPPLSVATFNGGLFDPERHPFLEHHTVGDSHLQEAVDRLTRVNGQFVDYRDLAERHLGTIYEGLLEYHLEALDEPEEGWTLALLNDKGERKATGSYYTPDYIVKYIVDQTVTPVLLNAVEGAESDEERVQAVLGLNVLDPAMGSGHFLVEAVEHIARFLVELGIAPVELDADGEAELAYWKRRVAQSCVYGVDLNPLAVDLAKLSLWLATVARDRPLSFLDHHLRTGNSLVGVRISDLHPADTPRKRRKKERDGETQLSMIEDPAFQNSMSTAVGSMWLIEESPADTLEEVKEQERIYETLRQNLTRRYARLADLAASTHFGVEVDRAFWKALGDYAAGRIASVPPQFNEWLDEAAGIATERRFFHWELEFPEVFFDRQGRPKGDEAGFDAVVGNPPYVQSKHLRELKPYLQAAYSETYKGKADLYVYFFQLGLSELKIGGRMGCISSGLFSKLDYGAPLRQFLTSRSIILEIVEFGEEQVFEGALTYPIILFLENEPPKNSTLGLRSAADLTDDTPPEQNPLPRGDDIWAFTTESLQHVIRGWTESVPLGEVLGASIYRGITTNLNHAFVLDHVTRDQLVREDASSEDLIKPLVKGEGLRPWHQSEKHWLILLPLGWTRAEFGSGLEEGEAWASLEARYPSIATHLAPFAEAGRGRTDKGEYWWELRACDYYWAFEKPRIHSTKVSLFPTFSFSEEVTYALNTSYVLPIEDTTMGNYLLGVLNSRVCEFYCRKVFAPKANGYFEIQPGELSKLPVPDTSDDHRSEVGRLADEITAEARTRYTLHERTRQRIFSDLGEPGKKLNQKLTAWWTLDFSKFRAEVKNVFMKDIPLIERDEWEEWLAGRRAGHDRLTAEIVRLETDLNAHVYDLFNLTPEEIRIIEESTKYRYGEV
jgi:hypothetical protein